MSWSPKEQELVTDPLKILFVASEVEGFAKMLEQQVMGNAPPKAP